MSDSRYRSPWELPDCPECDGHIPVGGSTGIYDYKCHRCDVHFDA